MLFAKLLQVQRGVTAIIGAGGKTTLLHTLARELQPSGRVIVCTTTHIFPPSEITCITEADMTAVDRTLQTQGIVCVGTPAAEGKLCAPQIGIQELATLADYVLVEADGARGLPVKAHEAHEPVIPQEASQTILVLGLSGLGQSVFRAVHRPERFCVLTGAGLQQTLTPQLAAKLVNTEALHTRVFLNQADTSERQQCGRELAQLIKTPVCMGALQKGSGICLY